MPINRIQFQPVVSMPEFFSRYGSEEQCAAALKALRWPQGTCARTVTPPSTTSLATVHVPFSSVAPVGTKLR